MLDDDEVFAVEQLKHDIMSATKQSQYIAKAWMIK